MPKLVKNVAVICEFSGEVREAFRARGHHAVSFDILPAEDGSPYHVQGDCLEQDYEGFDLAVCHPPCTNLAVSGARHFEDKHKKDNRAIYDSAAFAFKLWNLPIPQLALENPISILPNQAVNGEPHPVTGSRVVLTVAHRNHTPEDCSDENLIAWCQRCHLTYDAAHHARNAAVTRRAQRNNQELFT